jgi:hypothetical protein
VEPGTPEAAEKALDAKNPPPPSSLPAALPIAQKGEKPTKNVLQNGALSEATFLKDLETFLPRAHVDPKRAIDMWKNEIPAHVREQFLKALSTESRTDLFNLVNELGANAFEPKWDDPTPFDGYHYKRLLEAALIHAAVVRYLPKEAHHLNLFDFDLKASNNPDASKTLAYVKEFLGDGPYGGWNAIGQDDKSRAMLESIARAAAWDYKMITDKLVTDERKFGFEHEGLGFVRGMLRSWWPPHRKELIRVWLANRAKERQTTPYFGDRAANAARVGLNSRTPGRFGRDRTGHWKRHGALSGAGWSALLGFGGLLIVGGIGTTYFRNRRKPDEEDGVPGASQPIEWIVPRY